MMEESGRLDYLFISVQETYLEPCQTTMIKFFAKLVKGFYPLTIFPKVPTIDV